MYCRFLPKGAERKVLFALSRICTRRLFRVLPVRANLSVIVLLYAARSSAVGIKNFDLLGPGGKGFSC